MHHPIGDDMGSCKSDRLEGKQQGIKERKCNCGAITGSPMNIIHIIILIMDLLKHCDITRAENVGEKGTMGYV